MSDQSNAIVNNYEPHSWHYCIDAYKELGVDQQWLECPKCKLRPKVWVFDNGEHTACGCWENMYDHFDVQADETICEVINRTGGFAHYNPDAHRQKWNQYCLSSPAMCGIDRR